MRTVCELCFMHLVWLDPAAWRNYEPYASTYNVGMNVSTETMRLLCMIVSKMSALALPGSGLAANGMTGAFHSSYNPAVGDGSGLGD